MIKKLFAAGFGLAVTASAYAAPILPPGPLYINFNNMEQISSSNSIGGPGVEGNWGVFVVAQMSNGGPIPPNQLFSPLFPIFNNSATAQITGMFYGTKIVAPGAGCVGTCFDAAGGFIDLYYQDSTMSGFTAAALGTATPGQRTATNQFTNFTDGQFLARLAFASGIDSFDSSVDIRGSVTPSAGGFSGFADSFANVVDINGDGQYTAADGAYAFQLNSDLFNTAFGQRDVRLKNSYNLATEWNGTGDILGASSSDPIRAFVVPEPGTLALLGASLLGLAGFRRKKSGA